MYPLITYPFDVIKTNRIVGSAFAKEATENLPREFIALHERGQLSSGLFRGLLPGLFS